MRRSHDIAKYVVAIPLPSLDCVQATADRVEAGLEFLGLNAYGIPPSRLFRISWNMLFNTVKKRTSE